MIKRCRINLHLSAGYVARYLGMDEEEYVQIENGVREVSDAEARKLSYLFGVRWTELMGEGDVIDEFEGGYIISKTAL